VKPYDFWSPQYKPYDFLTYLIKLYDTCSWKDKPYDFECIKKEWDPQTQNVFGAPKILRSKDF